MPSWTKSRKETVVSDLLSDRGHGPSPLRARQRQRPRINLPSRKPMLGGDRGGGVLYREGRKLLGDFPVERGLGDRRARLHRPNDDDDLASGRAIRRVFRGKLIKRAAPHLLMQLG